MSSCSQCRKNGKDRLSVSCGGSGEDEEKALEFDTLSQGLIESKRLEWAIPPAPKAD